MLNPLDVVQKGKLATPKIPEKPDNIVAVAPPVKPKFKKVSLA